MTGTQANAANEPDPKAWPPAWKIWANPIFRRYCRSRLRPRGLSVWILLSLLISGFLFFMFRQASLRFERMDLVDAERTPLIALLIFQGIILFLLGTGQVAGGMTAESDEGVLDYQRLAPMSPLAKVLGYLFGLPIREYVLVLVTMPFSLWSLWRGEVPLNIALQLYGIFFTAGVMYHLTGLLAGTVVKNKRWAFLASMGVIFLLYTVIPQMAKFGLVYFKYVTIMPVFEECYPHLIPRDAQAAAETLQRILPSAKFFNLDFPQVVFTLLSQGVLIVTMMVMLWRRWRRSESHLLGKAWATVFFGWVQLVLLGNALPLIESGALFPSRGFNSFLGRFRIRGSWQPEPWEPVIMVGCYGVVTLAILWVMMLMVSPNAETRLRGWRRVRKLGQRRFSLIADPATAFPWMLLMAGMGSAGWFVFARELVESRWFAGQEVPTMALGAFALVMATGGLGFHALLEGRGPRASGMAVIFIGVVPIMVGSVLGTMGFSVVATWLLAISPVMAPMYASGVMMPMTDAGADIMRSLPRAFWFWQLVGIIMLARLMHGLRQSLRTVAKQADEEGKVLPDES
jgi:hypothetical protein